MGNLQTLSKQLRCWLSSYKRGLLKYGEIEVRNCRYFAQRWRKLWLNKNNVVRRMARSCTNFEFIDDANSKQFIASGGRG